MVLLSPYNLGIKWHYLHFIDEETNRVVYKLFPKVSLLVLAKDMKSWGS